MLKVAAEYQNQFLTALTTSRLCCIGVIRIGLNLSNATSQKQKDVSSHDFSKSQWYDLDEKEMSLLTYSYLAFFAAEEMFTI